MTKQNAWLVVDCCCNITVLLTLVFDWNVHAEHNRITQTSAYPDLERLTQTRAYPDLERLTPTLAIDGRHSSAYSNQLSSREAITLKRRFAPIKRVVSGQVNT